MRKRPSLRAIFAVPLGIGVLSLLGLISALTGDGLPDVLAWLTLAVPLAVVIWAMKVRRA